MWHVQDSQGQILALAFRSKALKRFRYSRWRRASTPEAAPKPVNTDSYSTELRFHIQLNAGSYATQYGVLSDTSCGCRAFVMSEVPLYCFAAAGKYGTFKTRFWKPETCLVLVGRFLRARYPFTDLQPLSEYGPYKTVKARFWFWLLSKVLERFRWSRWRRTSTLEAAPKPETCLVVLQGCLAHKKHPPRRTLQ